MRDLVKGKIVTPEELTKLMAQGSGDMGITYDDIKKMFNNEDLANYDKLCMSFVNLMGACKSNEDQWNILFHPTIGLDLMSVLNRIQEIREKYALPGVFHRVWRAKILDNGNFEYDEISW